MLTLQVVPAHGGNAYRLFKARIKTASTWHWSNKAKTRLKHVQRPRGGYIHIADGNGVLVAHVKPNSEADLYYLAEKLIGRLIAWYKTDLAAINMQFDFAPTKVGSKRRRR